MNNKELLIQHLNQAQANIDLFLSSPEKIDTFNNIVFILSDCLQRGGRIYVAGNGGSCSDASHLVAEMVGKLGTPRSPLPAENLGADNAVLTCIANDYGYDMVFARQLQAKMKVNDVFLALSTSGQSVNIHRALATARNFTTILITRQTPEDSWAGYTLEVGGNNASETQEVYYPILHALVKAIEKNLGLV